MQLYAQHVHPAIETLAYCLLHNHFHFLVRVRTDEERLAEIKTGAVSETAPVLGPVLVPVLKPPHRHLNNFFIAYARAINNAYQRTGSLFEKPYRRKVVESERYFTQMILYIHQNPQRHSFVADFRDWPWSSYHAMVATGSTHLSRAAVLAWFGGMEDFVATHRTEVNQAGIQPLVEGDWF